uniref:Si:ch211-133n4.4 n=1 Tax=Cyclopterus lumpus TaxID=8103 RepID=A0A8C2XCG1_CYCLU
IWKLLPFAACLFLSITPTVTEVVDSMSACDRFLLQGTPPLVPGVLEGGINQDPRRYKTICQTFRNQQRFVTLYDTQNRIPVFSAYKYRGVGGGRRPNTKWRIELEGFHHQAINSDYTNNNRGYNRGHLFPSSHALSQDDKISTFTLTNVVPQAVTFNDGSWKNMESCVQCVLNKFCIDNNKVLEGFVVTGARPSRNNALKERVNIPSVLWSAFCCYSNNRNTWLASAHWGNNVPDGPESEYLETKTLDDLHRELRFEMFPGTPLNNQINHNMSVN